MYALWVVLAAIIAVLLLGGFLLDRRGRRRGHRIRSSGQMWGDLREANRDARARVPTDNSVDWTSASRRNRGTKP